jgi:hypothetical protein
MSHRRPAHKRRHGRRARCRGTKESEPPWARRVSDAASRLRYAGRRLLRVATRSGAVGAPSVGAGIERCRSPMRRHAALAALARRRVAAARPRHSPLRRVAGGRPPDRAAEPARLRPACAMRAGPVAIRGRSGAEGSLAHTGSGPPAPRPHTASRVPARPALYTPRTYQRLAPYTWCSQGRLRFRVAGRAGEAHSSQPHASSHEPALPHTSLQPPSRHSAPRAPSCSTPAHEPALPCNPSQRLCSPPLVLTRTAPIASVGGGS